MTKKRRYRKVLRKLDPALMSPLPTTRGYNGDEKRLRQMYENLWAQFGLTPKRRKALKARYEKRGRTLPCVSEWAWTEDVEQEFYEHPYHKEFVKKLKRMRDMTWGMWGLQCEPSDYEGPNK